MNPTYEISSTSGIQAPRKTPNYKTWRAAGIGAAGLTLAFCVFRYLTIRNGRITFNLCVIVCSLLAISAMVIALSNAKHFGRGNVLRTAWLLIAPMGIVDCLLLACYTLPGVSAGGVRPERETAVRLAGLILAGTTLSGIARLVLAYVLWKMIGVYRGIAFKLRLHTSDYVMIVVLIAIATISVLYASNGISNNLRGLAPVVPDMMGWFPVVDWFRLLALSCCAVLGVIAWRYATDSGGGLVAKAWRSVLMYAALYLGYLAYSGLTAHFVIRPNLQAQPTSFSRFLGLIFLLVMFIGLVGSELMLFLGTTYQNEASNSAVELDAETLNALAAADQA